LTVRHNLTCPFLTSGCVAHAKTKQAQITISAVINSGISAKPLLYRWSEEAPDLEMRADQGLRKTERPDRASSPPHKEHGHARSTRSFVSVLVSVKSVTARATGRIGQHPAKGTLDLATTKASLPC
jgi:hypothetical protein